MKKSTLILITCVFFLGGCATVEDFVALDKRVSDLELHRIKSDQEQKKLGENWELKDGQYAGLRAELKKLEEEIQTLNGKIEELEFAMGQLKAPKGEISLLKEDARKAADRIAAIEQYLGLNSVPKKIIQPDDKVPDAGVPESGYEDKPDLEKELYEQAKRDFDRADFESARKGFQKFVKLYPKSESADNAQFWIGETYFREAWYEKAILEYEEVKKRYAAGNKVPSALLKQGMSFQQLNEKANARLILEELVKKFPKSSEAEIAAKILKTQ